MNDRRDLPAGLRTVRESLQSLTGVPLETTQMMLGEQDGRDPEHALDSNQWMWDRLRNKTGPITTYIVAAVGLDLSSSRSTARDVIPEQVNKLSKIYTCKTLQLFSTIVASPP